MTNKNEIYKCELCRNTIEILNTGASTLICCGQEMKLMEEKSTEGEGKEKHLPVIEKLETGGVKVRVGEVPHPMEEEHHIEWIEIKTADDRIAKKYLQPGDSTEVEFNKNNILEVRAYCNIHGLWKTVL